MIILSLMLEESLFTDVKSSIIIYEDSLLSSLESIIAFKAPSLTRFNLGIDRTLLDGFLNFGPIYYKSFVKAVFWFLQTPRISNNNEFIQTVPSHTHFLVFNSTFSPNNNPIDSLTLNRTSHHLLYDCASEFVVIPVYCKSSLGNVSSDHYMISVCGCGLPYPTSTNLVVLTLCGHPDTPAIKSLSDISYLQGIIPSWHDNIKIALLSIQHWRFDKAYNCREFSIVLPVPNYLRSEPEKLRLVEFIYMHMSPYAGHVPKCTTSILNIKYMEGNSWGSFVIMGELHFAKLHFAKWSIDINQGYKKLRSSLLNFVNSKMGLCSC
ncbi:hypothetical protein H8356DRAFT_1341551 [Neocallimastix lanati (nom. inval.)]|nr:hypothetical protein H8356DRAFT_1341551 [Neocallimastix sp. JGI-2020a]